jgi:hypothetical protein
MGDRRNLSRLTLRHTQTVIQSIKQIQQDATIYQNFIIPYLSEAQHVSGYTSSIIGSLKQNWQPLVFHTWKIVGRVVGGRCQVQCAWQRPTITHPTTFHVWKTKGCHYSFMLLMMGMRMPETCWASYKYGIIKFWYIVASCFLFYELCCDAQIHEHQDSDTVTVP